MEALQNSISLICSDAAKSYLRSGIAEKHVMAAATAATSTSTTSTSINAEEEAFSAATQSSNKEIYNFLASHFEAAAETKNREHRLSISKSTIPELIQWLQKTLSSSSSSSIEVINSVSPAEEKEKEKQEELFIEKVCKLTLSSNKIPRVNQRDVTSFLDSKKINTSALPEVFEMTRVLQQIMSKKMSSSSSSTSNPQFGTTNCIHFVSVFSSLVLVRSLFEMLSCIIDALHETPESGKKSSSSAIIQMICTCWSLIDPENAPIWNSVSKIYSYYPGMTTSLLLELFPSIETIGQSGSTFLEDVEEKFSSSSSSSEGKNKNSPSKNSINVVSYDPDEEGESQKQQEQQSKKNNEGDEEYEEGEEDEEEKKERESFWSDFASAPK